MDDLITAVADAIDDETELHIGQPSGIGDALARAALRIVAERFQSIDDEDLVEGMAKALARRHLVSVGLVPSADFWDDFPSAQDLWRDQAEKSLAALGEVLSPASRC